MTNDELNSILGPVTLSIETEIALLENGMTEWMELAHAHAARVTAAKDDSVVTFALLWRDSRLVRFETTGIFSGALTTTILTANEPCM